MEEKWTHGYSLLLFELVKNVFLAIDYPARILGNPTSHIKNRRERKLNQLQLERVWLEDIIVWADEDNFWLVYFAELFGYDETMVRNSIKTKAGKRLKEYNMKIKEHERSE